jgi:hypothetical protein
MTREQEIYKQFADDERRVRIFRHVREYLRHQMVRHSGPLYMYYLEGAVNWDRLQRDKALVGRANENKTF